MAQIITPAKPAACLWGQFCSKLPPMRFAIPFSIIALLIAADQLSKWWISEYVIRPLSLAQDLGPLGLNLWLGEAPARLPYTELAIWPFFNIVMVWNEGVSFGLFDGAQPVIMIALALLVCTGFLIWLLRTDDMVQRAGLMLVIGGALGNVIDRVRFGAVIDFLDFHAFGYHWPAFNLADSFIVIGVCVLIVYALFFENEQQAGS